MKFGFLTLFYRTTFSVVLAFVLSQSFAQDCNQKIADAEVLYASGQLQNIVQLIEECTQSEDENIRWKAHRLLALVYIETNEKEKARNEAIQLLEINPTYTGSSLTDPSEFIKLLKSITIIPKLSFGITLSAGTNATQPEVLSSNFITETTKTYRGRRAIQFDFSALYQINRSWSAQFSAFYSPRVYNIEYNIVDQKHRVEETLAYLNFPLVLRFHPYLKTRIRPFVQAGAYGGFLLSANNSFYKESSNGEVISSLENINSKNRRENLDLGYTLGIGAYYRFGPGQLFIQASYYHSLAKLVKDENLYQYNRLVYGYYYLDDDFKLHNTAIGVGYSLYLNYKVLKE